MGYPRALVWGRRPRDEQVRFLVVEIRKAIQDEVGLPATPLHNILRKVERAIDDWDPFDMTWYPISDEEPTDA